MYSHGHTHPHHVSGEDYRGMDRAIERLPPRDHRQVRDDEYASHRGSSRRALNAIQWRLSTEQPIEEELQDDLTPRDVIYKPQVPREFRDDRRLTYEDERDRRRPEDERRMDRRLEDDRRYERRYQERKSDKAQGRNYRKELLERFADMELEDHQEFHGSQRYYE